MFNCINNVKQKDNGIDMSNLGFFGKIPLTGDFIHRRMGSVFMNRWDEWLKINILHSQKQLGERWLPIYSQSPMWRFCIAPGVIDDKAYLGIMIPSVDSVGRYFPLTVAQAVDAKAIPFMLSDMANQWFQNIEDLLLDLLEGYEPNLQVFDAKIAALQPKWISDIAEIPTGQASMDKAFNLRLEVNSANTINHSVSSFMLHNMIATKKGFTFWWNEGSEAYQPSILLADKLPATDQFCGLLDGSWHEHQWISLPLSSPELKKTERAEKSDDKSLTDIVQPNLAKAAQHAKLASEVNNQQAVLEPLTSLADLDLHNTLEPDLNDDLEIDLDDITISPLVPTPYHRPHTFKTIPESFGFTDPGNSRKQNEDALLLKPSAGLWLVADGMGGHSYGSYASQLVVNRIAATDISGNLEQALNKIHIALQDVNTHLIEYAQQQDQSVCGSTVIGMMMNNQTCVFFWAGDSRLYLVRNQKIIQLSKDHSVEQEQIDQGLIEKDDPNFNGKNLITRAVGGDHHLALEICYHQPLPGDQFFLCSDGVYNEISDQEIENIINMPNSAKERCLTMNEEIISRAARDNFTGIIVEV
ncbi:MAG: type VI secretion system ImpM family protein [Oleispira sp.]|jgi:type VI secretion system ImpM family protein